MNTNTWTISSDWTLFLDRDGVINRRLPEDYVKQWEEFHFLPGVKESLKRFGGQFGRIVIVTNQQGIGKGLMTEEDLAEIHHQMMGEIVATGGRIDRIYHCPALRSAPNNCRKPRPAMAYQAQTEFPEIVFSRSVMVGDSLTDIEFGKAVGMHTVWISDEEIPSSHGSLIDLRLSGLAQLVFGDM
ncbi:MAG: HAD family hydrolase [Bacteroidota bacterium]